MTKSLRLFSAIELPQELRALAGRYMAALRGAAPSVRASWDKEEKLHLTLKFFGDVEESRVEGLSEALERAAARTDSFDLRLQGTGAFPPSGSPRVLWLGVLDSSGGLAALHREVEAECARLGFPPERRPFNPHLTIARLRSQEGARRLAQLHKEGEFQTAPFNVRELVLIRSELLPQGSRYTRLSSHRLREGESP